MQRHLPLCWQTGTVEQEKRQAALHLQIEVVRLRAEPGMAKLEAHPGMREKYCCDSLWFLVTQELTSRKSVVTTVSTLLGSLLGYSSQVEWERGPTEEQSTLWR